MKVIADICVVPLTGRTSVRKEVARAHEILQETGCNVSLHGYGTNIQGDFDTIMAALRRIHEELHESGVPRIHTNIKLGSRTDKPQSFQDKLDAIHGELESKK